MLNDCLGKAYILYSCENYVEFLKNFGVDHVTRRQASNFKPTIELTKIDEVFTLTTTYPRRRKSRTLFRLGEIVDRKLSDGSLIETTFEASKNKLIETQHHNDKIIRILREFFKEKLIVTMETGELSCRRFYRLNTSKTSASSV